ncbi:MAG: pentapeptide repeat-containing protein [Alphaproteobacteria bacterium]|nr:pentapeptide repeat-containing protein [Alphaproteobacteria bacterium]
MRLFQIRSRHDHNILFEGRFPSFRRALEHAVTSRISLESADLRHANLLNACLDDAQLQDADFSYANLTGANLSEAMLSGCRFTQAQLYNTCLAYADLRGADFAHASFGATDVTGANLSGCRFAGLSCFTLDFTGARAMQDCSYESPDGQKTPLSFPPVVIRGFHQELVILMDQCVHIGHKVLDIRQGLDALRPAAQTSRIQR